jgi:hypothetical protein
MTLIWLGRSILRYCVDILPISLLLFVIVSKQPGNQPIFELEKLKK